MPEEIIEGAKPETTPPGTDPGTTDPGQGGTPPATDTPGEKPVVDPGDGKPAEEQDFIEKDGVKYYKDFSKHPEWRDLKDSKTATSAILEEHGFTSMDDVVAALQRGNSLADLIGTTDANKVQTILDDAQEMGRTREFWAEKEAQKLEKGETQEETIARLKKEKAELKDARRTDAEDHEAKEAKREQLTIFNRDVGDMVDLAPDLSEAEKGMLKLHLGVDNPMDEINIGDRKAVRTTAKDVISKFSEFIKGVRQSAIDTYAEGKSDIVPAATPAGDQTPVVEETKVDVKEGTSIEEAFDQANQLLVEQLTNTLKSE